MDERQVGANNSAGGCSTTEIQFRAATLKRHTPISKPIDRGGTWWTSMREEGEEGDDSIFSLATLGDTGR